MNLLFYTNTLFKQNIRSKKESGYGLKYFNGLQLKFISLPLTILKQKVYEKGWMKKIDPKVAPQLADTVFTRVDKCIIFFTF